MDKTTLAEAQRALSEIKNGTATAMYRAINRALDGVSTDAAKVIATEVNLTQKIIKGDFSTYKATPDKIAGTFRSRGRPVALIHYGASQVGTGVSVRIKKDRPRKVIAYAFIATMKSGHQGVFQRTTDKKGTGTPIGSTGKLLLNDPGKWPRQYRLPIKELFGPRVEDIFENKPVMDETLDKAAIRLNERFEHEVEYLLERAKNA